MKKLFSIFLIAMTSMCLIACGSKEISDMLPDNGRTYPTMEKSIEEVVGEIWDTVANDYVGDLGDIVPAYKDIYINNNGTRIHIMRELSEDQAYVFYKVKDDMSDAVMFETMKFDNPPNGQELFTFSDLDGDGYTEILATNYVFSTAGFVVTDAEMFSYKDDTWVEIPVYVYGEGLQNKEVSDFLCAKENEGYDQYSEGYGVRDLLLTPDGLLALTDKGTKEGANTTLYYSVEKLTLEGCELKFLGEDDSVGYIYWPFDMGDSMYNGDSSDGEIAIEIENGYSAEELCIMAEEYCKAKHGSYAQNVGYEMDADEEGLITIHLYDVVDDHTATYDWLYLSPETACGTDLMEENVDISSYTGAQKSTQYTIIDGLF